MRDGARASEKQRRHTTGVLEEAYSTSHSRVCCESVLQAKRLEDSAASVFEGLTHDNWRLGI